MKNDIKTKNFIVMRRYKPQDDDFFDDNPVWNNSNNHTKMGGFHNSYMDTNNQEDLEQEQYQDTNDKSDKPDSKQDFNQEQYKTENKEYYNIEHLLNISDIDITNLVVNLDLNLNIFDPYDLYDSYNNDNDDNDNNNDNDNDYNNFFGES
jgi:hypothetical protein